MAGRQQTSLTTMWVWFFKPGQAYLLPIAVSLTMAKPLSRGKAVPKTESDFIASESNVAAIDFGTTYCSLAYMTRGDEKVSPFKLSHVFTRVLNALLLRKTGDILEVAQFGYRAQEEYSRLRHADHLNYLYFERMKILDKVTTRLLSFCIYNH